MVESYLRQRFHNPLFHNGDVEDGCKFDDLYRQIGRKIERSAYDIRFFQDNVPGKIYAYIRIDGASDSPKTVERKVADALYHESSDHAFVFVDEIGELYKKGLEDCLRPVMTAGNITVYATAQNVRGKLRSDTSQEDADRRRAFFRRFPRILETSNPSEAELLRFLAKRIHDWNLGIDSPDTLRVLVKKSGGVVGYAIRSLIKAINEPDRRLTKCQVLRDDAVLRQLEYHGILIVAGEHIFLNCWPRPVTLQGTTHPGRPPIRAVDRNRGPLPSTASLPMRMRQLQGRRSKPPPRRTDEVMWRAPSRLAQGTPSGPGFAPPVRPVRDSAVGERRSSSPGCEFHPGSQRSTSNRATHIGEMIGANCLYNPGASAECSCGSLARVVASVGNAAP